VSRGSIFPKKEKKRKDTTRHAMDEYVTRRIGLPPKFRLTHHYLEAQAMNGAPSFSKKIAIRAKQNYMN